MNFSKGLALRVYRTLRRVFPRCGMISQATAFNLFLAFFPTLLFAIAVATSRLGGRANLSELIADFTNILPPGQPAVRRRISGQARAAACCTTVGRCSSSSRRSSSACSR